MVHPRQNLQKIQLSSAPLVVAGNAAVQQRTDMAFPFAQEANFLYVTGLEEAGWWLLFVDDVATLVAPERSEVDEIFNGGASHERILEASGADEIITSKEGLNQLRALADTHETVQTIGADSHASYYEFELNPGPGKLHELLSQTFKKVEDVRPAFSRARAIKDLDEIAAIERAIAVTADGFTTVRSKWDEYVHEYEIEADFSRAFRLGGGQGHAYAPIVATGANACTLHYGVNNDSLQVGQLLLMDVGARFDGYNADITRTYAVGEEVSDRYKEVYAQVLAAQRDMIGYIQPGASIKEYVEKCDARMREVILSLGLDDDLGKYFPHAVSHGLGVDVHDSLGGFAEFQVGMVLTVEPGIYILEENVGVRIEDDVLVTEDGARNLSAAIPVEL